jgi:lon-related putative ATP-dependent protease
MPHMDHEDLRLPVDQLRRTWDPADLGIDSTADLEPLEGMVGQERAVSALQVGLSMKGRGFNVYVSGPPGIGKRTALECYLRQRAAGQAAPSDWVYVNDFDDPYCPRALPLPAGRGREFQQDVTELVTVARRQLRQAFESDDYAARRTEVVQPFEQERSRLLGDLHEKAAESGFAIKITPVAMVLMAVKDNRPLSDADLRELPDADREGFLTRRGELELEVKASVKALRENERRSREGLKALDHLAALFVIEGLIDDLVERYEGLPEVERHLRSLQADFLENLGAFLHDEDEDDDDDDDDEGDSGGLPQSLIATLKSERTFSRYRVNLLVGRPADEGAPVVIESNPSYQELFGRVERESRMGTLFTDFTMIKSGALHRANGGYLVLPVEDLLRNFYAWEALVRALRTGEILVEEPAERLGLSVGKGLRPQPIPLDVKVILIGSPLLYHLLYVHDPKFSTLFKVKADFETSLDADAEGVRGFLRWAATLCQTEGLRPLASSAMARLLEHACRLAGDQRKLSARFGLLADVIREADLWAERSGAERVEDRHVNKALDEHVYRSSLIQERIEELTVQGTLLVSTEGRAVGQVNGLSVTDTGDHAFGRPQRITATAAPGRDGILDIEREVELSGPIHSKGVLVLGGYLATRYARKHPLTLTARLVFEQSYGGVDGDSASVAELCALLSALGDVPLEQGIAVTGSVNQHGEVQAVGGVDEKVEGFFTLCAARGLTGTQGVILPRANVRSLMLSERVTREVVEGRFHVWAVERVDQVLELLSDLPAGEAGLGGVYPAGTFNRRVCDRLEELAEQVTAQLQGLPAPKPRHLIGPGSAAESDETPG